MTTTDESLIEYPCNFPIKAMGRACDDIEGIFLAIVRRHFPEQESFDIEQKHSSGDKYLSVTITVHALNRQQLDATYMDLSAHDKILMSL